MRVRKASICNLLVIVAFLGLVSVGAQATTIHVPADYSSIQAAINASSNGDTIIVAPGTYSENINFQGKAITVMSSGGPAVTTIDGGNTAAVVVFNTNEGPATILQGFTITNGYGTFDSGYDGGGIYISSSSPTIKGNTITANQACAGSGIALYFASPQITGNTITNNSQGGCSGGTGGGGILIQGSSTAQITGNIISGNSVGADGGGVSLFAGGTPTIEGNIITGNTASGQGGGIVMVNSSDAIIVENLITGNSSFIGGGGIAALVPSGDIGPTIVNNTIAGNQDPTASGIFMNGFDSQTVIVNNIIVAAAGQTALDCDTSYSSSPPVVQWNDAFSSSGVSYSGSCAGFAGTNGNISAGPLFVDPANNDFHLQNGSPAIDAGTNSAPDLPSRDLDGNPRVADGNSDGTAVVDMGAYEFFPTTSTVTPSSLTFAEQAFGTTSPSQSVTVANTGTGTMLLAVSITGDFVQTNDCGSSVAAGISCTISVSFKPATRGTLTGNLTVVSNTAISPAVVSLSGTGIGPAADISPLNIDFGNQLQGTTSSARTVTVTDVGELPLSFTNISATTDFAQTNTCAGGIAVGANCTVSITFTPSATGQNVGSLTFTDNAADSPQAVVLTGNGVAPAVTLNSTSLTFANTPVGSTSIGQSVTLTNSGTSNLTISGIAASGDFAIDSAGTTCTTNTAMAPSASCKLSVFFTPTAAGTRTGALTITDDALNSPQTLGLTGSGEDFSVGARTTSSTISAGGTASYDILVSPEGGFSGNVSLTCSGAPSKSTCMVSPASVTLNGTNSSTVTLKVTTTAASGIVPPVLAPWDLPPLVVFWIALFVLLGLGVLGRFVPTRIGIRPALLASLAAVLLAITFWTACGGGNPPAPSITPGTASGTYTLTVTGVSGGLTRSTTVSLTVQ